MSDVTCILSLKQQLQMPNDVHTGDHSIAASADEFGAERWRGHLERTISELKSGSAIDRRWTFDMDDGPELQAATRAGARWLVCQALEHLRAELQPIWCTRDAAAIFAQTRRRWAARFAICSGIAAIILAVVQLELSHFYPALTGAVTAIEVISVMLAAAAVVIGFALHFHHNWLMERQAAERLRSLKFESLGWHELWSDLPAWRERVTTSIGDFAKFTAHDAERWATADDIVALHTPRDPGGRVTARDVQMLADYYRVKRLEYQQAYFDRQSEAADQKSWATRWKVSAIAFWISVIAVLLHGMLAIYQLMHAEPGTGSDKGHGAIHGTEIILVGLAALLPVIGFGCRAWSAAFEFPRSRNLFRAKSKALNIAIRAMRNDRSDLLKTMSHIVENEHFFLGEHREWCRLQFEAEWYV